MNTLLVCDNCAEPFDVLPGIDEANAGLKVPLILKNCGCTMCSDCVEKVLQLKEETSPKDAVTCPLCNEPVVENSPDECRKNTKLINFMTSQEAFPLLIGSFDSIPCSRHP